MQLSFFIARRYLVSKKSNNAVNIISWISVCAIAIATAALVIVLSFMNGLTGLVKGLYNSFDPDIEINVAKGKTFIPDDVSVSKIKNIKGVKYVCFSIEDDVLLNYIDKQSVATVKGVSNDFFRMTNFNSMIREGRGVVKIDSSYYAILGKGLVYQLSTNLNDLTNPISFYAPKRGRTTSLNPDESLNEEKLTPSAYFSINDEFDSKYVLVHIDVARKLFDYENEVSTIDIGLENISYSDNVEKEIKKIMGTDFIVKNRFQQNKLLFNTLATEKLWTFIVLIFILVVATFNIIGALTMLILEKKKDIITLSNIGADSLLIRKIFLTEGVLVVLVGALSGLALGFLVCFLQMKLKFIPLEGTDIKYYPVEIELKDFISILISVFIIGSIAAWIPVRFFTKEGAMDKFRVEG